MGSEQGEGRLPVPRRLTGGPEIAPRVHSDLAGQAAGLREIPAKRGGAGSEQSEEQKASEQPSAPRPAPAGSWLCAGRASVQVHLATAQVPDARLPSF